MYSGLTKYLLAGLGYATALAIYALQPESVRSLPLGITLVAVGFCLKFQSARWLFS